FSDRRHVGQRRHSLRLGDRKRDQLASLHGLQEQLNVVESHLHLAADQRERGGARSPFRYVHEPPPRFLGKKIHFEGAGVANTPPGGGQRRPLLLCARRHLSPPPPPPPPLTPPHP